MASKAVSRVFYEFRKYSIQPSKFSDFIALTQDKIHLRTKHSKLFGYWTSELGGLNEVVHLWEYDSFEQRRLVRKALSEDKEWIETYISKMMPWVLNQDNMVVFNQDWAPAAVSSPGAGGVYDLQTISLKPGHTNAWSAQAQRFKAVYGAYATNMGAWKSDVGTLDTVLQLSRYNSGDERLSVGEKLQKDSQIAIAEEAKGAHVKQIHSRILIPTKFSPLQ